MISISRKPAEGGGIAAACDGSLSRVARAFGWMPAHTSAAAVGRVRKASGLLVTFTDWRANRLCDALATATAARSGSTAHARASRCRCR